MNYTIYTVTLPGYPHTRCFEELSLGLASGFRELGYSAKETGVLSEIEGRAIVLGAHLINTHNPIALPADAIVYNTEQAKSGWTTPGYMNILKIHTVLDYSLRNIEDWKHFGIDAIYCGVGYAPELERIPEMEQDIDVLFYGSVTGRRLVVLQQILDAGINLHIVPLGTYGKERDDFIARSKIVLNIHAHKNSPLEMVRCSYLLANKKRLVNEDVTIPDADIKYFSEMGLDFCNLGVGETESEMVKWIPRYINDEFFRDECLKHTKKRYEAFKRLRQSDYIKAALSELPASRPQHGESV